MNILITGAAGFVGAATTHRAIARGHTVTGLVRPDTKLNRLNPVAQNMNIVKIQSDYRDEIFEIFNRAAPHVIIHTAWNGVMNKSRDHRDQIDKNIAFSCNLIDAAIEVQANTFIGLGSQAEYGLSSPMSENSVPQPTTLYGAAKLATYYLTRQLAHNTNMRHCWLRLFSTYGPNDNEGWLIPYLIQEFLAGRRPKATEGKQVWDYLFIDDVADAILAVAETPSAAGLFNLGSGQSIKIRDIVTSLRDMIVPDMALIFGEVPYRTDQIMHLQADINRLVSKTNWGPKVPFSEGLERTVAFYRQRQSK